MPPTAGFHGFAYAVVKTIIEECEHLQPYLNRRRGPAQEKMCMAIAACEPRALYYVADEDEPLGGRIAFDLA